MKLTDKHVSDGFILRIIDLLEKCERDTFEENVLKMALELKQRREADRQADPMAQALNEGDGVYRP